MVIASFQSFVASNLSNFKILSSSPATLRTYNALSSREALRDEAFNIISMFKKPLKELHRGSSSDNSKMKTATRGSQLQRHLSLHASLLFVIYNPLKAQTSIKQAVKALNGGSRVFNCHLDAFVVFVILVTFQIEYFGLQYIKNCKLANSEGLNNTNKLTTISTTTKILTTASTSTTTTPKTTSTKKHQKQHQHQKQH